MPYEKIIQHFTHTYICMSIETRDIKQNISFKMSNLKHADKKYLGF